MPVTWSAREQTITTSHRSSSAVTSRREIMRAVALRVFVAAMVLQQSASGVQACGDKFLLIGRGAKFRQAYAAIYPASIVLFARGQSGAGKAIRDPRL